MSDNSAGPPAASAGKDSTVRESKRGRRVAVLVLLLVVLGILAYANSLPNTALFRHAPTPYTDPILQNSILRSSRLFPKIFTREFLLTTYGEYRPAGYAMVWLMNRIMPQASAPAWHVVLIGLHVVTAALIFLLLRMLVQDLAALALAAVYVLHPLFGPLVNDSNMIYFLWGLLFTVATLWLFLAWLKTNRAVWLLLSILSFAVAVFTYKYAMVAPAFLITLCLFHETHPRGAVTALAYLALAAFGASMLRVPLPIIVGALSVLMLFLGGLASPKKRKYLTIAKVLPPYLVIIGLFVAIAASVKPTSLFDGVVAQLRAADMTAPFQPRFVCGRLLGGTLLHAIALAVAVLAPIILSTSAESSERTKGRTSVIATVLALAYLLAVTVWWNGVYRDDIRYWERMNEIGAERPSLKLNLAIACTEAHQLERARDILLDLWWKKSVISFACTTQIKLAKVFAGLGNKKLAGYYFYGTGKYQWQFKVMKNLLNDTADFCFSTGFLSEAECFLASGLVIDPYDPRLYNKLGRILIYKNFFRAAEKHFRHALSLDPRNADALYYLAFLAKVGGRDHDYDTYVSRWRQAADSKDEIDFQPIYDAYDFDPASKEKYRSWFSGDPMSMLFLLADTEGNPFYSIKFAGKNYNFPEVPLEIAEHFIHKGDPREALRYLAEAYKLENKSKNVVRRLARDYRRINQVEEAERLERMLKEMPDDN